MKAKVSHGFTFSELEIHALVLIVGLVQGDARDGDDGRAEAEAGLEWPPDRVGGRGI